MENTTNTTIIEQGGTHYEQLYKKLWKEKRVLYYNFDVDDCMVDMLITPILMKNIEEKDIPESELKPIEIWINSDGGDVFVAMSLIDVMQKSRIPIDVRVLSKALSAGLLITLAGRRRIANKNTIFLLHEGSSFVQNASSKAKDTMKFLESIEKKVDELVLNKTNLTPQQYKKIKKDEFWCFGDKALELGFVTELE